MPEKFPIEFAGASYVSPGVGVDGGGFIIIGGKVIPVPPWNPEGMLGVLLRDIYTGLTTVHMASIISDPTLRHEVQRAAVNLINRQTQQLGQAIEVGQAAKAAK